MKYDFETICRRDDSSLKYSITPEEIRRAGMVSFSAGEMDFPTAPCIIRAVKELADNGLFGFTTVTDAYRERVRWWMEHARQWEIKKEWIVPAMGTIYSVATAIRMAVKPGEGIIVPMPGYNRYEQAARRLGRRTVFSPMREVRGRYEMDFDSLERCMADPSNKLLILCNPHNPTGRVWSREELTQIARLSAKYKTLVYSDEIFAEVTFGGRRTVPYSEISEGRAFAMVCTSLGKCFNFTGVNHANLLIPNRELRERFTAQRTADHYGSLEPFAYASLMGAYTEEGLDWKNEMVKHIDGNRRLVEETVNSTLFPNYVFPVEGTYVCWIRWKGLGLEGAALNDFLEKEALLSLEIGTEFGEEYGSCTRMNLASTRRQTAQAMERLEQALGSGLAAAACAK